MSPLERIARAALAYDALAVRSLVQDWLRTAPLMADVPRPSAGADLVVTALVAALAELWAERLSQPPPDWAAGVGPVAESVYLLRAADWMPRLRQRCLTEAPQPLRTRRFYAPADYLRPA